MSGSVQRAARSRIPAISMSSIAAAITASLCVWQFATVSSAKAAGLSTDSDIVGLRTTMSTDQIKTLIRQEFKATAFPAKTIKLTTPAYSRDVVLGFTGDIISKAD